MKQVNLSYLKGLSKTEQMDAKGKELGVKFITMSLSDIKVTTDENKPKAK